MSTMVMKVSYYVDAPVESVFDFFMDPSSDTGFSKMEVLEAKRTKEGVGTFLSWRVKIAGIPWRGFEVVTDLVPNRQITEQSSSPVVGTWEYRFEPEGSGTRLTMEHRPRSLWALPLVSNLIDYGTTRMSRSYMERAKAKLEAEAAVPSQRKPAATKPRKPAATRPRKPAASR